MNHDNQYFEIYYPFRTMAPVQNPSRDVLASLFDTIIDNVSLQTKLQWAAETRMVGPGGPRILLTEINSKQFKFFYTLQ